MAQSHGYLENLSNFPHTHSRCSECEDYTVLPKAHTHLAGKYFHPGVVICNPVYRGFLQSKLKSHSSRLRTPRNAYPIVLSTPVTVALCKPWLMLCTPKLELPFLHLPHSRHPESVAAYSTCTACEDYTVYTKGSYSSCRAIFPSRCSYL